MQVISYDRVKAVDYAHRWAFGRNPHYYNFDPVGGDCTNFASQCIYAGCGVMNYTRDTGWYYRSSRDRAAAWTGVEYLAKFLLNNKSVGPFAELSDISEVLPGDIIQLSFGGTIFHHSPVVVSVGSPATIENILVAAHTFDADNRPLSSYHFEKSRVLHILGARIW